MSPNYLTMKPLVFPCINTFNWSKASILKKQASKQANKQKKNSKPPLWATFFWDERLPNSSVWDITGQ